MEEVMAAMDANRKEVATFDRADEDPQHEDITVLVRDAKCQQV
jgi:hypothetical protein